MKADVARLYLDLMKKALSNELYLEMELRISYLLACLQLNKQVLIEPLVHPRQHLGSAYDQFLQGRKVGRVQDFSINIDGDSTTVSHVLNYYYHTCIGEKRLDNIEKCIRTCVEEKVPGDLIETGVWRGGACVYMQAILTVLGATERNVWLADSFKGYPVPKLSQDTQYDFSSRVDQAISVEEVRELFERYGLSTGNVRFLEGWFKDTLPAAPIERLAILRLDGNLYESTMDALTALYAKVSRGGFVIVDDYGPIEGCKQAIHDFLDRHRIKVALQWIDDDAVYWRVHAN
jgi:hypothetical protein